MADTLSSYTLVFLHMPKAAGSTLQGVIERQYRGTGIYDTKGDGIEGSQACIDRLRALPDSERAAIRCLKGHLPYGVGQWLREPVRYVTMLRHPLARALSDYNYALSNPAHRLHHQVHKMAASFSQYVEMRAATGLGNLYTRLLSGCVKWDDLAHWGDLPPNAPELARQNASRCAAIGITENFDESLLFFKRRLGWSHCFYVRENVTAENRLHRHQIGRDAIKAVEQYFGLDLELYEYCRGIFERQVQEAGPGFASELAAFRRYNYLYQQVGRAVRLLNRWRPI